MYRGYRFVDLTEEDRQRLSALEHDLGRKYGREIVLIAYEKTEGDGEGARMEVGRLGVDSRQRGTTFGYGDAHFDAYPTLADMVEPSRPVENPRGQQTHEDESLLTPHPRRRDNIPV